MEPDASGHATKIGLYLKGVNAMFTVIIPAYNAALYIKKSIESVLNQTIDAFEILVIDDGSTDDTKNKVEEVCDNRVRYIYQPNGGVSSARNTGIQNAKGEYICFLDADDEWKPHHLEVIFRLTQKYSTADVFITGHEILLHTGEIISKACPGVDRDMLCDNVFRHIWEHGYFIHTNSMACKASVFETVGLFEVGVKNGEDDDMWYRMFLYFSVAIAGEITTTYIRENSNATQSKIFVTDWIFSRRCEEIYASNQVTAEKKDYLRKLMEQRKLSYVRFCILNGDKKTAKKHIKLLDRRLLKKKKYMQTWIALLMPSFFSSRAVRNRDKKYYRT